VSQLQLSEHSNHISDDVRELRERWNNRLVFPLSKISERYQRGDLCIHLHLLIAPTGNINIANQYRICVSLLRDRPGSDLITGHNQHQFVMLVDSIKFMDYKERVVHRLRTVIGLQFLDSCLSNGRDNALYFSLISGEFLFLRRFNGIDGGIR
jgi:hypothetical protein